MSHTKKRIADLLFVVQIIFAFFFCGDQFVHMWKNGAAGVSVVMFASVQIFLAINLYLAVQAHKVKGTRVTKQALTAYGVWTFLWAGEMVLIIKELLRDPSAMWNENDTIAAIAVIVGLILVQVVRRVRKWPADDPMVKGSNALVYKAVPQLFQGWKFWVLGPASWSGAAIAFGHITILVRLGILAFSIKEAGWDRNRTGSAVSEIGNEFSWIFATVIWIIKGGDMTALLFILITAVAIVIVVFAATWAVNKFFPEKLDPNTAEGEARV